MSDNESPKKKKKTNAGKAKAAKGKKEKKAKDPNAPKRGLSAYVLYSKDNRARIKEENPDAPPTEIMKLLGDAWKEADDSEKKKYNGLAEKDKKRYEAEKKEYEASGGGAGAKKGKGKRAASADDEEEDEEEADD